MPKVFHPSASICLWLGYLKDLSYVAFPSGPSLQVLVISHTQMAQNSDSVCYRGIQKCTYPQKNSGARGELMFLPTGKLNCLSFEIEQELARKSMKQGNTKTKVKCRAARHLQKTLIYGLVSFDVYVCSDRGREKRVWIFKFEHRPFFCIPFQFSKLS